MKKEDLTDCLKVFYAALKQKDGKDFKVSSLHTIRAAIERYLQQPAINKPWSIVWDTAFETANKVLNAICRKNAQEGKASPIVHKQPLTKEQVKELFRPRQLGECDTQDPAQLLRTTWFYITLYFGKRGRENQRKLTKELLLLQSTPQGRQYYEQRWIGRQIVCSSEFAKMPGKNSAKLLKSPQSWMRSSFPTSKRGVF